MVAKALKSTALFFVPFAVLFAFRYGYNAFTNYPITRADWALAFYVVLLPSITCFIGFLVFEKLLGKAVENKGRQTAITVSLVLTILIAVILHFIAIRIVDLGMLDYGVVFYGVAQLVMLAVFFTRVLILSKI